MDAIVQFYREGLSCVKDLGLFQDSLLSFLWDSSITLRYYDFPTPLNQTTPLEVLISIGQLYAVVSLTTTGWTLFATSIGKLMRIQRFIEMRKAPALIQATGKDDTDRFINESLVKEGMLAIRSMIVGFITFFLGLCFIWLFAHSWHITETDWIGGLQGLIHALTVMNLGLAPLLYFMWKDGNAHLVEAKRMKVTADQLRAGTLTRYDLSLSSLESLTGWKPFWEAGVSLIVTWTTRAHFDEAQEEKSMAREKKMVENSLTELFGKTVEKKNSDEEKKDEDEDDGEKEGKIRKGLLQDKADEVASVSYVTRVEGYREFIYFILNCVAFYGYFLCIICFYYPHPFNHEREQQEGAKGQEDGPFNANTTITPLLVRHLMFHMDPQLADWRGNFAGDFMWTLEAVVIFGSPLLISLLKTPNNTKATSAAASTATIKAKAE
jgi:hypothetical protein